MGIIGYRIERRSDKYSAYHRATAINPSPRPWTTMNPFAVSTYSFSSTPKITKGTSRSSYSAPWVEFYSEVDMSGVHVGRLDVGSIQSTTYQPLGLDYAGEVLESANADLFGRLKKQRDTGFNAAVFTAELGSTIAMFANTAVRINRSIRAARRGRPREAWAALGMSFAPVKAGSNSNRFVPEHLRIDDRTVSGRASNILLELQYGWKPLLSDMDKAAHKFASSTVTRPPTCTVTGRASDERKQVWSYEGGVIHDRKTRLSAQITLQYRVENALIAHAASLGLTNPFLVVHEVVPLSFVLDWFISVGSWLEGFSAFHGLRFVQSCDSCKGDTEDSVSYPGITESRDDAMFTYWDGEGNLVSVAHPSYRSNTSGARVYSKASGFTRSVGSSFPAPPSLKLNVPGNLFTKLAVSLSLLRQRRTSSSAFDKLFA